MFYRKELKYIDLIYSDKDLKYINDLIDQFEFTSEEIVSFFRLNSFGNKVKVKLFDSLKDFRSALKAFDGVPTDRKGKIAPWICGISLGGEILTLCLKEFKKTKGHKKEDLDDLIHLVLHEFVHECHKKASGTIDCYWLSEGLATSLSHQKDGDQKIFHATMVEMRDGSNDYTSSYTMFQYVYGKYGHEYILDLIYKAGKAVADTPKLYEEVIHQYQKSNPDLTNFTSR